MTPSETHSKFTGALLGTMIGDALGAPVEGWECETLNRMLDGLMYASSAERALSDAVLGALSGGQREPNSARYTDDTQMTIGLAEALASMGYIDGPDLARRFAENFERDRGYGPGAIRALTALRAGTPWDQAANLLFGGQGSFGNGAAMRVAPVGLFYHAVEEAEALRRGGEITSRITHTHPLGVEGAVWQAAAVAAATRFSIADSPTDDEEDDSADFDPFAFLDGVQAQIRSDADEYQTSCRAIRSLLGDQPGPEEVVEILGNGVEAHLSVPAALYAFLAHYDSFPQAVLFAIRMGGDSDTIGAMCGAIAGAFHGADALPTTYLSPLENGEKGRDYVRALSDRLFDSWLRKEQSRTRYRG